MICPICPHACNLNKEGQLGFCKARVLKDGKIIDRNYGLLTSMALDPIEKKPLRLFYPGTKILSVGSFGCSMCCPFCQNWEISQVGMEDIRTEKVSPENLIKLAKKLVPEGNIGIAFTYNEPTVSYEYVFDSSLLAHKEGLKTVLVTNGMINEEPLKKLLPYIDAMNIDLKSFNPAFYKKCGGALECVKRTIQLSAQSSHLEIATLIIPGENDSVEEMEGISSFLASVDPTIALHIDRFFPCYRMESYPPTPVSTLKKLSETAQKKLKNVFIGNV